MVFESIVVELINRYLGAFVENLDSSQLTIGIWSAKGDIVLSQLNLKENALQNLDLPFKVRAGHLAKLTLKIPWKNLYTESSVIQIQGVYALVIPATADIKYNEESILKAEQENKQARLAQLEMKKRWEKEKEKSKETSGDSFVEKLATQIIKNIQIKISNIHIRLEDSNLNLKRPFSLGFTLHELVFQTTDANWKETIIKEAVSQIYKLVRLSSLCVYWNCMTSLLQDKTTKQILAALEDIIPKQGIKSNLQFLLKPISAVAHLRLNTKPEVLDFIVPKFQMTLVFDEIALALSKSQYDDIICTLETMERIYLITKYRRTRPTGPYKGHYKEWWHHAYAVILKYNVQRRRNMWKWKTIKKHRENIKVYRDLYTQKLDGKRLSRKEQTVLVNLEEELDLFNICMCRNQAQVAIERQDKKREMKTGQVKQWFESWYKTDISTKVIKSSSTELAEANTEFNDRFQKEFTDGEKMKLYKAIGYDENSKDQTYPQEFVAVRLIMKLGMLSITLTEQTKARDSYLLKLKLSDICASFGQRPSADSIRLEAKVDQMRAIGFPRSTYTPKLISSVGVSKEANISLLNIFLETNPLDGKCESRIRISSRALEIIYDAVTINALAEFFRLPESVRLKQLSNAAMARYDDIKAQTAAGVIYMMSERKYADVEVHLMPSYFILPQTGELGKDVNMLLINLGSLNITSERTSEIPTGVTLAPTELASYAYDKFNASLDNVQILFVQPGDSWQDSTQSVNSPLYILRPMTMALLLQKCLFSNDPNLPQFKVTGELPLVAMAVSDTKLLAIMKLIDSIPFPQMPNEPKQFEFEEDDLPESVIMREADLTRFSRTHLQSRTAGEYKNLTQLAVTFLIKEISIEMRETVNKLELPYLQFVVIRMGATLKARTYDLSLVIYVGGVFLYRLEYKISQNIRDQLKKCDVMTKDIVTIINSPFVDDDEPLLSIHFVQADKRGPEFRTTYNSTAQSISIEFSMLDLILHQGVILSLLDFANKFEPVSEKQSSPTLDVNKRAMSTVSAASRKSIASSAIKSAATASAATGSSEKSSIYSNIQLLKIKAIVDNIQFGICNAKCVVMHSKVEGIEIGINMHNQKLTVSTLMRQINVTDPDPKTYHPMIFSVVGSEMLKMELIVFLNVLEEKRHDDVNTVDMIISLQLGRVRTTFVNKFIMSIVHFLDNFAVAKTKLTKAGRAVKEASKDVAITLTKEDAPHVKLNVVILAPVVVIPQSSKSRSVLIIHLGDITVQNSFNSGNIKPKTPLRNIWVTENLVVKLSNLQITRGILQNEKGHILSEVLVVQPMSFKVDVCRNLSSGYYHGIPNAEVKGVLDKIDIKLNQEDLRLMMQIATENIDERNPIGPCAPKSRLIIIQEKRRSYSYGNLPESSKEYTVQQVLHSVLKLEFQLQEIHIELYRGLVNLFQPDIAKPQKKLLTYLTLMSMVVNMNMFSDSSMKFMFYLHDINMDDCRQEKTGGITKLIRRTAFKNMTKDAQKARDKENKESMVIHMSFDQNNRKDKIVTVHVCSLHLCLCVEFLMTVADFFTKAIPEKDPDDPLQKAREVKAILERRDAIQSSKYSSDVEGSINLNLKLEKPEIFFIADQMNPHTDSLIIDVELIFHMMMTSDILNINGNVKGLSVISCVFQKEDSKKSYFNYFKWQQSKVRTISAMEKRLLEICYNYYEHKWEMLPILNYVVNPIDITIYGSGPQNKDHHVDIHVTDVIINITPSTVRLLSSITEYVTVMPEADLGAPKLKDYSHIWDTLKLKDHDFWFTQSVEAAQSSALTETVSDLAPDSAKELQTITILYVKEKFLQRKVRYYGNRLKEMLPRFLNVMIYAPVIVLKLEGGDEQSTIPLVIMDAAFSSQMHNWTSDIYIKCSLAIGLAYNNENIGVWEPVIEPVSDLKGVKSRRWELIIEMVKNPDMPSNKDYLLPPPKMTINIHAINPLQIIISKTFLDVLYQLGEGFSKAYQLQEFEGRLGQQVIPILLRNRLGTELMLMPDPSLQMITEIENFDWSHFASGKDVGLKSITSKVEITRESITKPILQDEKTFIFQLPESSTSCCLKVKRAKKLLFTLDSYQVVVNVEAFIGQKIITFLSVLQIKNHLNAPMNIMYVDASCNCLESAGEVFPFQIFNVPLSGMYSKSGEIYFQLMTEDVKFLVTKQGISWQDLEETTEVKQMCCLPSKEGESSYYFNILPQFEKLYLEDTEEAESPLITIHLHPTVIIHNLLPFPVQITVQDTLETHKLEAGHNIPLSFASVNESVLEIVIINYRNMEWKAHAFIELAVPELHTLRFLSTFHNTLHMDLGLHCKQKDGSFNLTVFSPYWIVNMTDLDISLKHGGSQIFVQEKSDKKIMLFFYERKSLLHKGGEKDSKSCMNACSKQSGGSFWKLPKHVNLKVGECGWSRKFSLDTVGSGGNITCKNKILGYSLEVGLSIRLGSSGLTKIVTFTPFYLLINTCSIGMIVREVNKTASISLPPGECKSFYSYSIKKELKIVAQLEGSNIETVPFYLNKPHTTLLRLGDRFGGIYVECQVSESAMITTFRLYKPGLASVLFVNDTTYSTFTIKQGGSLLNMVLLEPQTAELYTWSDPTIKREISWSCSNKRNVKNTLDRDKIDKYTLRDKTKIYLVTFLDGLQRVAMFTEDRTLAALALEAGELEQSDEEINIRISNVGFSLINNEKLQEILYMGITSSGIIWEEKKKKSKAVKIPNAAPLEIAYQKYLMDHGTDHAESSTVVNVGHAEVDFGTMKILSPYNAVLKRSAEDGIWVKIRISQHYLQVHAKINRLQIDNQLRRCVFPTILSPVSPPRSIVTENVPKPFIEVSLITRVHDHSNLLQIKYLKVLIQEMNLKVDSSLVLGLLAMFAIDTGTELEKELVNFEKDIELTRLTLKMIAGESMLSQRICFYDFFHISPIKIHLSFSLESNSLSDYQKTNFFSVFLQSLGVVLTDVQDVVFKLGYFERTYCFYNNSQLTREFIKHYSGQAVKQMYVLVLGLDVLGNPYGLLLGVTEGIEDLFYEPYQGAILGPQEFAKGLRLGLRSLFSHTVGGTAGAISKMTGALGKGLAALSFDKDYQQEYRMKQIRKPTTAKGNIVQGGKELVMGVYNGIVDVVKKPIEGGKQGGTLGFIKGVGKGLIGIVIKPTSGLLEFTSLTLEGIYRLTDFGEEISRLRPPFKFSRDGIITPYNFEEAEGYNLLLDTDKGRYTNTDEYIAHAKIKNDNKRIFIVTDKRVLLIKYSGLFGHWDTEWMYTNEELQGLPTQIKSGIEIKAKPVDKKSLFGGDGVKKEVFIADAMKAKEIIAKMTSPPSPIQPKITPPKVTEEQTDKESL